MIGLSGELEACLKPKYLKIDLYPKPQGPIQPWNLLEQNQIVSQLVCGASETNLALNKAMVFVDVHLVLEIKGSVLIQEVCLVTGPSGENSVTFIAKKMS